MKTTFSTYDQTFYFWNIQRQQHGGGTRQRIVCRGRHILTLKGLERAGTHACWPKTCLHSKFLIENENERILIQLKHYPSVYTCKGDQNVGAWRVNIEKVIWYKSHENGQILNFIWASTQAYEEVMGQSPLLLPSVARRLVSEANQPSARARIKGP